MVGMIPVVTSTPLAFCRETEHSVSCPTGVGPDPGDLCLAGHGRRHLLVHRRELLAEPKPHITLWRQGMDPIVTSSLPCGFRDEACATQGTPLPSTVGFAPKGHCWLLPIPAGLTPQHQHPALEVVPTLGWQEAPRLNTELCLAQMEKAGKSLQWERRKWQKK